MENDLYEWCAYCLCGNGPQTLLLAIYEKFSRVARIRSQEE